MSEERIKELEEALKQVREDITYARKACLCKRFSRWKEYRGFDYGQDHRKLGKCEAGARWLTPSDKLLFTIGGIDKVLEGNTHD